MNGPINLTHRLLCVVAMVFWLLHIGPGLNSTIKTHDFSLMEDPYKNGDVTCGMPVIDFVMGTVARSLTCIYGVRWGGSYPHAVAMRFD